VTYNNRRHHLQTILVLACSRYAGEL